jgi:hypothetical protein
MLKTRGYCMSFINYFNLKYFLFHLVCATYLEIKLHKDYEEQQFFNRFHFKKLLYQNF